MIYLLSQMMLALAVAIVLGMALGWLIHRSAHQQRIHQLKQGIARQNAQLAQAQSDVGMLNDDYNDLHRKTHDQIDALVEENRQIPALRTNLEKSQLLVKQMMQRHETEVRDLTGENKRLSEKLAKFEDLENADNRPPGAEAETGTEAEAEAEAETESETESESESEAKSSGNRSGGGINADGALLFAAAESDEDPFDEVMEVADELQRELDDMPVQKKAEMAKPEQRSPRHPDAQGVDRTQLVFNMTDVDATETEVLELDSNEEDDLDAVHELDDFDDLTGTSAADTLDTDILESINTDTLESIDTDNLGQAFDPGALDDTYGADDGTGVKQAATTNGVALDGSNDDASLFEPVSQQDDLQQIFGIGPLTEKALNELGITSYSQLAELNQHEIQHIADALEIGPGRIERDNWVGNARRQLEEVLEQL